MLWIYIVVTLITAMLVIISLHYFVKNKNIVYGLTLFLVVIALGLTYFYISPYYLAWRFEQDVRRQSSFINLIAEKSPENYHRYIEQVKENIINKGDPINEVYYASELINALLIKYGPIASNESLYQYLKSDIEFDKRLFAIDPILVLFQEFPEKFANKIDLKKYNANEFKNDMLASVEKIVESGINNPMPVPDAQDITKAEGIFRNIMADIAKKYGQENVKNAIQRPEDPSVDKKMAAEIIINISEEIYATGMETAGLLLRSSFLVSKKQVDKEKSK